MRKRVAVICEVLTTVLPGQTSHNLGRLHVGWKTSVGEAGSVQSQPVMKKADQSREVAVTVQNLPKNVTCGVPFVATVRIANNSARSLQLQLQFRKDAMRGILCHSISHQVRCRLVTAAA